MKQFNLTPILPCKLSWDFSKKDECNSIIHNWQMMFQASDLKGNHFLNLLDGDYLPVNPTYTKGGPWLKQIHHSNSLCARVTRAITNHAPIGEYWLRFFLREIFSCPCGTYPIESRHHIFHESRRYNNYWNPNGESFLSHFIVFLEFNTGAFSFYGGIT